MLHRDMKAKDSCARLSRKQDRALLRLIARPAWTVHRKGRVAAIADLPRHFGKRPQPAGGARTARGAEAEALDALCDGLAIAAHAGHHEDSAVPPVVRCW